MKSMGPKPLADKSAACDDCGRAHDISEPCPTPREYHAASFLKKYGG